MNKLKKLKENWLLLSGLGAIAISIFMFGHNLLNQYDNLIETTKSTQQMALKSVIWNEAIPIIEREAACDVYLKNGWNSYTKKVCQVILEEAEMEGEL